MTIDRRSEARMLPLRTPEPAPDATAPDPLGGELVEIARTLERSCRYAAAITAAGGLSVAAARYDAARDAIETARWRLVSAREAAHSGTPR